MQKLLTRKNIIAYTLFPAVVPRIRELFISGFQLIPFFMALVYQSVRLLPPGHPYTRYNNLGKFGIRHVIAEAANNLVINRHNIDQIILFVTLLLGAVVVLVQVFMLAISIFAAPAFAQVAMPTNFSQFFVTANPANDLASMMFDLIFGIPDSTGAGGTFRMFGSCFNPAVGIQCQDMAGNNITGSTGTALLANLSWPLPIHQGLHGMFLFYNTGLLVVGALLTIYVAVTILMETAETGTPFGKRFNKVWAPVRLVVAFGLLMPFGMAAGGLNASQYIVLYAAKYGSGFANNGWRIFNTSLTGSTTGGGAGTAVDTSLGTSTNLISQPGIPEIGGLLQFLYTARVCREFEEGAYNTPSPPLYSATPLIKMYFVKDPIAGPTNSKLEFTRSTTYQDVITFLNGSTQAVLFFGEHNATLYSKYRGFVRPTCGSLVIPISDPRRPGVQGPGIPQPDRGAVIMQAFYIMMIRELWMDVFTGYDPSQGSTVLPTPELAAYSGPTNYYTRNVVYRTTQIAPNPNALLPPPEYKAAVQLAYEKNIVAAMTAPTTRGVSGMDPAIGSLGAIPEMIASTKWANNLTMLQKGWAAAGVWYNKVAELNGIMSTAALNLPIPTLYPMVMEIIAKKNRDTNNQITFSERFNPKLGSGQDYIADRPWDDQEATALWEAFNYWQQGGGTSTTHTAASGNIILDFINQLLGTSGLYSIRKNPNIHPLAQLVGVGRALIEASVRNSSLSLLSAGAGLFGKAAGLEAVSGMSAIAISLLMTIVTITLTMGFVLFYILPFLPFMYFFFAVGGWFKAIFEAMVGAPLWALSHIRIDGPGFAGPGAMTGYFMIFEIFLRPILIVFGMLGGIAIFSAQVYVLNNIWDLVTANLGGFDVESEAAGGAGAATSLANFFRGPLDEFFFTVIYTIIAYIMALASFKLVDRIPNNIMRWMGTGVKPFNDEQEDAGERMSSFTTIGAQQGIQRIGGSFKNALTGIATGKAPAD